MTGPNDPEAWRLLGAIDLPRLREARVAAHWAAQVFWAAGNALGERRDDDSHTAFTWDGRRDRFLGGDTPSGIRVGLSPADATVLVLQGKDELLESVPLAGRTLHEALDAVERAVARRHAPAPPLAAPEYDLPGHAVGGGGPFPPPDAPAATELAAWFHDARQIAEAVHASSPGASPVRVWPHHFDQATLLALDPPGTPAKTARSINVGFSPGDAGIPDPYFYVTPWPRPDTGPPPPPANGRWHTDGWFGAVLEAERITEARVAGRQRERVDAFVRTALPACRALLHRKEDRS